MNKGLTLIELLVLAAVFVVVLALLLPTIEHGHVRRQVACANNLNQLWKMQWLYLSQFGGKEKAMLPDTGSAFWKALTKTQPPVLDPTMSDVLLCPVRWESVEGSCDYGGPVRRVSLLQDTEPVGADFPNNHGSAVGGNVLRKSGDVTELTGRDWVTFTTDPLFPRP